MSKIIYKGLSYKVNGIFYEIYNTLGNIYSEKQYQDVLEERLRKEGLRDTKEKKICFLSFTIVKLKEIRQIL